MPGPTDRADLDDIETELAESLADVCELVIKIGGDSVRRFMFFAPPEVDDLGPLLERLRLRHSGRTFTIQSRSDPDHSIFAAMLENARDGARDLWTIQELDRAGADLSQPREISYTLVMPSHAAAIEASRGFETDPWRSEVRESDGAGNWLLTITQVEIVAPDRVAHYSAMFREVAKSVGGSLDGWGATVHAYGQSDST